MQKTFLSLLNNMNLSKFNKANTAGQTKANQNAGSDLKDREITLIHHPTPSKQDMNDPDPRLCYFQTNNARVYLEYPRAGEIPPSSSAALSERLILTSSGTRYESGTSTSEANLVTSGDNSSSSSLAKATSTYPTIGEPSHVSTSTSVPSTTTSTQSYTRFVCISDTHAHTFPVPPGDVLLHAGDLTNTGSLADFQKTVDWLCDLPHRWKIIIAGNHDVTLDEEWYEMYWTRFHRRIGKQNRTAILNLLTSPRAKAAGLIYLQDETFKFRIREGGKEWIVYGSPWSPEFCNWAFGYDRGQDAVALAKRIPTCDILLTHSPPSTILDTTNHGEGAGCEALLERVKQLRPRLNLFGHIHEGRGVEVWGWGKIGAVGEKKVQDENTGQSEVVAKVTEEDLQELRNAVKVLPDPSALLDSRGKDIEQPMLSDTLNPPTSSKTIETSTLTTTATTSTPSGTPVLSSGFKTLMANFPPPSGASSELHTPQDYTIFINAASWPSGPSASRARGLGQGAYGDTGVSRLQFGGLGFQPVVVDLLDVDDNVNAH